MPKLVTQTCPLCGSEDAQAWNGGEFRRKTKYTCNVCRKFVIDHNAERRVRPAVGDPLNLDLSKRAAEIWKPEDQDDEEPILYVYSRNGTIGGERRLNLRDFPW